MIRPAALLACATAVAARALALDPAKAVTQYRHDVWRTDRGLPQSSVECMLEAREGYLWFGTQEGAARFDGVRFVVYDRRTVPALRHNRILRILQRGDGVLFFATEGGGVTVLEHGVARTYGRAEGLPSEIVRDLAEGPDGAVWIATEKGVSRFRDGRFSPAPAGLAAEPTSRLLAARDGTILASTRTRGLLRIRDGRAESTGLPDASCLYESRAGAVYAGTSAGLMRLGDASPRRLDTNGASPDTVNAILEDRDGNLWVGTTTGLVRLRGGRVSRFTTREGLSNDVVLSLLEDREGSVWIGTQDGGLNRFADAAFTPWGVPEGLSGDVVSPILESRDGAMWIGTRGAGLNRLKDGVVTRFGRESGLTDLNVQSLLERRDGSLWVGTRKGLCRLDGGRFSCLGTAEGLVNPSVRSMTEDREGRLWVGTGGGGLHRLDGRAFAHFGAAEGLSNPSIFHLLEARDGSLLMATNGGGLNRLKDGRITAVTTADGLSIDIVNTLHEDADGTLWIGTYGGGLCRARSGAIACWGTRQGLFDEAVFRILDDEKGNLWISCNRGVYRVAKSDLEAVARGEKPTVSVTAFAGDDGMRNAECNGADQPTGWRTRAGVLWFPTIAGAVAIDPEHLPKNPEPPPVVVESVVADGRESLPGADGSVSLAAAPAKLEIRYAALSFRMPPRVRFRTQLEGYDRHPTEAGSARVAHYTHLPPGSFDFRVTASNEDGVWNERGASLHLVIPARFFETWWFRAGAAAGVALLVFGGVRLRLARAAARERALTALVAERTRRVAEEQKKTEAALKDAQYHRTLAEKALHEAEGANRTKSRFLASTSHELRTPLNAILGYAEILEEDLTERGSEPKSVEDVRKIHTAGKHLLGLINDILDLSKIEAGKLEIVVEDFDLAPLVGEVTSMVAPLVEKNGNRLDVNGVGGAGSMRSDPTRVRQVLFNLLSNAAKFTSGGTISLDVERKSDGTAEWVTFFVSDTGIGMTPSQVSRLFHSFAQAEATTSRKFGGTGLGLAISKRLARLLGGDIWVSSTLGAGTTFTVRLPARTSATPATG